MEIAKAVNMTINSINMEINSMKNNQTFTTQQPQKKIKFTSET